MRAIVQDRFGGPDVLALREVPRPEPGPGQALIRVHAASINARDWHLMRGDPYLARLMSAGTMTLSGPVPKIRGTDFAGVVEAVGGATRGIEVGATVYGEADGAFADYVVASMQRVAPAPANLSMAEAAALPLAANTALMGVRDVGKVQAGQRILINGASGGVGLFAVALARHHGAEVTAVCSARNVDLVRQAGAHEVIDYTRTDFVHSGRTFDVLFDLVANRKLRELRHVVTPTGTIVLSGGGTSTGGSLIGPMALPITAMLVARFAKQRLAVLSAVPSRANLDTIRALAEQGILRPTVERTYPLAEAAAAISYMETEHTRAKVVLTL